ncbi:MAG: phosphoribosylformylglycinamidine synthase subunit PurS [Helicobacteraceae bacterium]|jgi:phosphoribosylformylglycinamidine synthase|nr:phosphoribosylformylglycinamidine synthase subunit PurS [Helicobacteraceae bacterium]
MKAIINVSLKEGILDPQGKATRHALKTLGFENLESVRIGKQIVINLNTFDAREAREQAQKMAEELLVNEVIEEYSIDIQ